MKSKENQHLYNHQISISMKTAIITGAASGLGLEFSKLIAADGYDLVMVDKDSDQLVEAQDSLEKSFSTTVESIVLDLARTDSAELLYESTKHYNPELIINNAGFGVGGDFNQTAWNLEQQMIHLHVLTPTRYCKLMLNDMIPRGKGKIMNVSSVAAFSPGPYMTIYYATKAYLYSFGLALSNELKGSGVSLTTVCPGLTKTGFPKKRAALSGVAPPNFGVMAGSAEEVARIAYHDMNKGKTLSVPLFKNRFVKFLMWLLPESVVINYIKKSQAKLNGLTQYEIDRHHGSIVRNRVCHEH